VFDQDPQSKANGAWDAKRKSFLIWLVSNIGVALAVAVIVCPSAVFADVVLREVGTQKYYSRFSNPLPSDPNFFPLGVSLESVVDSNADLDKEAGLNVYVALTSDSDPSLVQSNGMRAILQQAEWAQGARAIEPAEVKAAVWHSVIAGARGIIYFNPQFRRSESDASLPARTGIRSGARRGKEHEPAHHAICASPQRTIRGRLRRSYANPLEKARLTWAGEDDR
jgi:hypothetical protein